MSGSSSMTRICPRKASAEVTSGGRSGTVLAIYRISLSDCDMAPVAEETALMDEDEMACAAAAGGAGIRMGSACGRMAGGGRGWGGIPWVATPAVGKDSS